VTNDTAFFEGLGARIRKLRERKGLSQEDMIMQGYSVRYWQKVEAGKPITLRTLLRICRIFSAPMHEVMRGLNNQDLQNSRDRRAPGSRNKRPRKK
jgi:transcriptional regulator with XRE-family HTH domain